MLLICYYSCVPSFVSFVCALCCCVASFVGLFLCACLVGCVSWFLSCSFLPSFDSFFMVLSFCVSVFVRVLCHLPLLCVGAML